MLSKYSNGAFVCGEAHNNKKRTLEHLKKKENLSAVTKQLILESTSDTFSYLTTQLGSTLTKIGKGKLAQKNLKLYTI